MSRAVTLRTLSERWTQDCFCCLFHSRQTRYARAWKNRQALRYTLFLRCFHKDAYETDRLFGLIDFDPFWCDAHNKIRLVKKQSQETDRQADI